MASENKKVASDHEKKPFLVILSDFSVFFFIIFHVLAALNQVFAASYHEKSRFNHFFGLKSPFFQSKT